MLRPVSFSIPSSTELKITFNKELAESLSRDNFLVESVSGNIDDLEVTKVTVEDNAVVVTTRPQVAGNFYVLKLLDADDGLFLSAAGVPLIHDDVSRDLYFVGLKNYNPIRDGMFLKVPKIYDLENTNIHNIIGAQAEEIFQAQKHIGEILSDNYISTVSVDEKRVRSSGATDRLSNEGAYSVLRVSPKPTSGHLTFKSLEYNEDSDIDRHYSIPDYPISLQEVYIEEEEISLSSEDNWFKGFLLSLSNKNIIKLIGLKHIKSTDEEDCDGEIGTEYNVSLYKYSIVDNRYDPKYAFSYYDLESNEVLLSEFGNIDEPTIGDTVIVSYLYKDAGIKINESSIEVYNLQEVKTESVPTNITRFFLENAPIVNVENEIPEKDMVAFRTGENLTETPDEFQLELVFNASKLPSRVGEYAINYLTGEVIVVGAEEVGDGTGSNNNIAEYLYRNSFSRNLDFYIKDDEFVAANNRNIVGEEVNIDFNYDKVYVEGDDYNASCHIEVFNEHVENNFVSSFIISPQNTPVTDVFRILNQTTGEVYSLLYYTNDEIYFTGSRSPEFKTKDNELAKFDRVELERLEPIGEFVCPTFTVRITANASNSSIQFSPSIPAELIDYNSQNYFIRSAGLDSSDEIEDLQIRFFGDPDSNNLIKSVAVSSTATAPSLDETVTIGLKGLAFSLDNNYIINNSDDAIGCHASTSIEFTQTDLFAREKYFNELSSNPGVSRITDDDLTSEILASKGEEFYENLSRLRKVGDYCVDYKHGQVYLAVSYDQDYQLGYINYKYGSIVPLNTNVIGIIEASKKLVSSDTLEDAVRLYENPANTSDSVILSDLENSILLPDGETTAIDSNGSLKDICVILDDFTVVLPNKASEIKGIYSIDSLEGSGLSSSNQNSRIEDFGSDFIVAQAKDGGGNIFDSTFMSFNDNVIDLKKTYSTRLASSGDNYTITINDSEFDEIYEIIHTSTDSEIFGEKLNVIKIDDLEIVSAATSGDEVTVDIKSGPILDEIDTDGDFLLDSGGSRFKIVEFDASLSNITVSVPAENNIEADSPDIGGAQVIVKASIESSASGVVITIPSDSYVNRGDTVDVVYKTTSVPKAGTKVGVNLRSGWLYFSYTYSYDDIYISYEHGDNEIDWSIGSAISEGETYYVTYRYGALRDALQKNFGILTKIPFFQKFSSTTDRELYRSALSGTMQAFTKGPTNSAFKGLIESFTNISPEITESVFGNWILGRDHLYPGTMKSEGILEFKSCKFNEGVMINDDIVISMPSVSNINLNEGTLSAWISPEWAGVDNDATLTIDIDNIGVINYNYRIGSNPFDYDNGFNVLASEHSVGGVDYSTPSITLHNYTSYWTDDSREEEGENIGAFALVKEEGTLNRLVKTEIDISLKVSNFSAPEAINPPRRKPSEDLAFSRSSLGMLGLGKSMSDASGGLMAAGSEMDLFRFCSPAFISIGDENKLLFTLFSLRPLYNPESGRIYTFRIGDDEIIKNDIPTYDRLHITKNCICSITDVSKELSQFRDKDYQSIQIINPAHKIPFGYISDVDVAFDAHPSAFRILDTRGAIYEVYAFYNHLGVLVEDGIPDYVSGFIINRIPINQQYITAQGSDAINETVPTGELTVLYQTISVLTNVNPDAAKYLDYEAKSYIVDWMSDFVDFKFIRDPLNNNVKITVNSAISDSKKDIELFYTDLIDVDKEDIIYEALNLDKWFNTAEGIDSVENSEALSNKIAIGSMDRTTKSVIDIGKIKYSLYNRFDENNIYIGASARNPRTVPFEINKHDFPSTSVGLPYNSDSAEGIFIGFDELCLSPLADDTGQWVFRTRASSTIYAPTGVCSSSEDLNIVGIPNSLSVFESAGFSKYISVFGVHVIATPSVSNTKLLHAASVLAQYLDNDNDGIPDNDLVLKNLTERNAMVIMTKNETELDSLNSNTWYDGGFTHDIVLYEDETNPSDGFDASLEEVLHLISETGYANAYPEYFAENSSSEIAKSMDLARGGYFEDVPSEYPHDAWYTYYDETCDYACQITEYFYWGLTSILGAQKNRCDEISGEWSLCTEGLVKLGDPTLYALLTDSKFLLPTTLPNGNYAPTGYHLVYSNVPIEHTFSGTINTNGEFSSVVRAHREEDGTGCPTGIICSSEFRYCGDGTLEGSDAERGGWRRINETDSELINILLGGGEAEASPWMRHGSFDTNLSGGVYRLGPSVAEVEDCNHEVSDGNFVYTSLPCYGGDYAATVSFKVSELDYDILNTSTERFEGSISGVMTGIVPIHIYDSSLNIKVALAISDSEQPLVLIIDGSSNDIVDISYLNWDNGLFNKLILSKDVENDTIMVQSDTQVLSRLALDDFSASYVDDSVLLNEPFFAIYLFDGTLLDIEDFHDKYSGNILDIGLIEYSSRYEDGANTLEDEDIFISTDSKIEFSFSVEGADGYTDGYMGCDLDEDSDGYVDAYGYESEGEFDVDEVYFTSDKLRYLFDSGESDSENRISIFKDGKGFMNFRIYDNSLSLRGDVNMYNIATNIKHFAPGELHHIAASWRLNTLYEKDEMHLFVDGLEAPNIYKFGGPVPVKINDKFSDVSKEMLQDFFVDNIEFCDIYTDGAILANSSTFTSSDAGFAQDMVGRSIIFLESSIATTYVGQEFIVNSVSGNDVTFVSGLGLDTVTFEASASDIKFMFPPTAGIKDSVATDLRNSDFSIFRTDSSGETTEFGGVLYTVDNGSISIISGEHVTNPQYRANIATKVIEFVGKDKDCSFFSTVEFSDLDVHIETFGLVYANCNDVITLPGSSYYRLDKKSYDVKSGKSVILKHAAEPVSLEDVFIKRIVMPRTIPSLDSTTAEGVLHKAVFEIDLNSDDGQRLLSSESGLVYKKNLGRYLSIKFDSDNTAFCEADIEGYAEGYIDDIYTNKITLYGETIDGVDSEIYSIRGNGIVHGERLFKSVSKMVGEIYIADPDYEPCVVELVETNPVTISDNNGEYVEVFKYTNGSFILTSAGSNGFYPFELHPGDYHLNYPAFLKINLPEVGKEAYIGCDMNGEGQFGGTIDEFRVITEMSSDTRPTERDTDGTRSITEDYLNPNPHCPDDQTLALIHFDDPISLQSRRLRRKEFLNTESNFKFKLDLEDREELLKYINDEDMFVSKMVRMGFDKDSAIETYIECHYAQEGPLYNETKTNRSDELLVSANSVNDNFGLSARFFDTPPLVINNRLSYFRKNEGTIEFWISPLLDTIGDETERYYVDIYSVARKRIKSFSPAMVDLPTPAKEIVSIQLLQQTQEFSEFYSQDEIDQILFDEIYRSEITGRLTGGTGVQKDFSVGSRLSADGKRIFLRDALPGAKVDVIVSYIPLDSSGDRLSIYKNERSQVVFSLTANGSTNIICKDVDWSRNTWHRIMCTYRTNSTSDTMRLFVDGVESGYITYGQSGVVYGTGFVYGQTTQQPGASKQINYNIKLGDDFRLVCIGSDVFEGKSALARMDNVRFSRILRNTSKDPSGDYIDPNYSSNTDTVMPIVEDDATTLILNFEDESDEDFYATVVDPASGIFNFDIEVVDNFGKIDSDEVEDLIVDLVERLKPAHSNALIKFPREPC